MPANYVNLPLPNTPLAERTIVELFLRTKGMRINPSQLAAIVDVVMSEYPRGKGTKGNPDLRRLYMACYAIKLTQSQGRRARRIRDAKTVQLAGALAKSVRLKKIVMGLPIDGSVSDSKIAPGDDIKLYQLGATNSYGGKTYLTDTGIQYVETIKKNEAAVAARMAKKKKIITDGMKELFDSIGVVSRSAPFNQAGREQLNINAVAGVPIMEVYGPAIEKVMDILDELNIPIE